MWILYLKEKGKSRSTTDQTPLDLQKLVLSHQSDTVPFCQCCQISADGGDVPNETKPAKTIDQ